MSLTDLGKNKALDAVLVVEVSLHTEDPTSAGTVGEVAGGSPAYARKAITWDAAVSGNLNAATLPVFDIPPSTTISHYAFWDASVACMDTGTLDQDQVFASQGTYTLTDADITIT